MSTNRLRPSKMSHGLLFLSFVALASLAAATTAEKVILVAGGDGRRDVEVLMSDGRNTTSDCTGLADAPFVTKGAVGVVDSQGRPMVCGGGCNPEPKSCHVYNVTANRWQLSPTAMLQKSRNLAATVKVMDGSYWVFGGREGRSTEKFSPSTDAFTLGPRMPSELRGLSLCAAPSAEENAAYISAANGPVAGNLLYKFDATSESFTRLNSSFTSRLFPSCGVVSSQPAAGEATRDNFQIAGGFECFHSPSPGFESYDALQGNWTVLTAFPLAIHGSASLQLDADNFLSVGGRVSAPGRQDVRDVRRNLFLGPSSLAAARAFPVAILADRDKVCPN